MDIHSAKFRIKITRCLGLLSLLTTLGEFIYRYDKNYKYIICITLLIIMIALNDYIRGKYIKERVLLFHLSYFLSNMVISYLSCIYTTKFVGTYYIFLVVEMLFFYKKSPVFLIIINGIAYVIPSIFNKNLLEREDWKTIIYGYLGIYFVILVMKSMIGEKKKTDKLNQQLVDANTKLTEYSNEIESLTIIKERTRIAQELHDSIGHSLVGLRMNLEYAKTMFDIQPEKSKEVLDNAYILSKDCIVKLREVVTILKDEKKIESLNQSLHELFNKFKGNDSYVFCLEMEDIVEQQSPEIKSCIYKTVMEGITNGIKHGNAKYFDIAIKIEQKQIKFSIKNDGKGCLSIVKSNGLTGIEERVRKLDGTIYFTTDHKWGFIIEASMPVRRQEK